MADDVITGYARGLLAVAAAEGSSRELEAELQEVARAVDAQGDLKQTLADPSYPAGQRQQLLDELLEGKASPVTAAMVSMVVGAGRAAHLQRIADRVTELGAEQRGREVAEVRTAVPLTGEQEQQLVAALKRATDTDVELKVIVDPSVLGGVITQIGDRVIDGSVRARLGQLREAF